MNVKILKITKVNNPSNRYDIQVKDNENFFANGVLVHNCSIYTKKVANSDLWETGICSRNLELKMDCENPYITTAKKYGLPERLLEYCKKHNVELCLRGELCGGKIQGKKNNPDSGADKPLKIIFFGVDDISSEQAMRIPTGNTHNLYDVCTELELECTQIVTKGKYNYDMLLELGEEIFAKEMIEGVVIRTVNNNKLSTKYINSKYDMK